jgi:DNA-binding MarR family transcriptional regulator
MPSPDPLLPRFHDWITAFMRLSMRGWIRYMKEKGLSISQVGALFEIHRGHDNVSDVGDALGISIAAASQMLERLVQLGLISRTEDPQDRRVKKLVVTEKGRRVMRESMEARQGWLVDLVSMLSPAEKQQVAAAVDILVDRTRQLDQAPEPQH